jgi:hypothetical protein
VISRVTRSFWKAYEQLNAAQKTAARRAFALFLENPGHNSLQFKKLRYEVSAIIEGENYELIRRNESRYRGRDELGRVDRGRDGSRVAKAEPSAS